MSTWRVQQFFLGLVLIHSRHVVLEVNLGAERQRDAEAAIVDAVEVVRGRHVVDLCGVLGDVPTL